MNKIQVYPVDDLCKIKGVVLLKNNIAYSCTLNQTDIGANKNKFYIMQLLNVDGLYCLYVRYGRISENGKIIIKNYATENVAILNFTKQFKAKTGNTFGTNNFVKKDGKYFMTTVQYEIDHNKIQTENINDIKLVSKLDARQNFLMELLTNKKTMENTLISLSIDPKKMPLGKISKFQLDEAEIILNKIKASLLSRSMKGYSNSDSEDSESDEESIDTKLSYNLIDLSSQFYTLVPYSCGRNRPPIINDDKILSKFTEIIDELKNLEVAIKVSRQAGENLDNVYDSLNAKLEPMDKTTKIWKIISDYIVNTHGHTHKSKIELIDIYNLQRNVSNNVTNTMKKIGNIQLLWHGSRMTNFCSIIKNGLILNPESLGVFVSGKMFGQGIYLASSFSKSFNYCASETSNGYACLLLCEVALGSQLERIKADPYLSPEKLKKIKCHSTWGQGKYTPSESIEVDEIIIPNGKLHNSGISSSLIYDEYVVYNTDQILFKYLITVKQVK